MTQTHNNFTFLYIGYEPAIAKEICKALKVKCSFIPTFDVDERLELLQNGTADIAVAEVTVTPEREGLVDFITPYYYGSTYQLYSANETVNVTDGWAGQSGKPVCLTEGSASEAIATRLNMIPVIIPSVDEATAQEQVLANIRDGKCIGFFTDYISSTKYDLSAVELPPQSFQTNTPSYLGIAIAKGSPLKKKTTAANAALFKGGANSRILALEREILIANGLKANAELASEVAGSGPNAPTPGPANTPVPTPAPATPTPTAAAAPMATPVMPSSSPAPTVSPSSAASKPIISLAIVSMICAAVF